MVFDDRKPSPIDVLLPMRAVGVNENPSLALPAPPSLELTTKPIAAAICPVVPEREE
jgi:hypothetical protein